MRRKKILCSMILAVAVLAGTIFSGCADTGNYTQEIKDYQDKLESLAAENEALKEQLGVEETVSTEAVSEPESQTQTVSGSEVAAETESQPAETTGSTEAVPQTDPNELQVLVFGDSIWDNCRDDSGVAKKIEYYMDKSGRPARVYNAAIGGTRATILPHESQYDFSENSENSLAKMVKIFQGEGNAEWIQGKAGYEDLKAALAIRDELDVVILSYGMNDFMQEAPLNADWDQAWEGYGTALRKAVQEIRRTCPGIKVLITTPTYGSYFPTDVQNIGGTALYNFAEEAIVIAESENTLCVDAFEKLGIDAYNADRYLEDGVHLTEKGRDLYARGITNCLLYGQSGVVSGNAIEYEDE